LKISTAELPYAANHQPLSGNGVSGPAGCCFSVGILYSASSQSPRSINLHRREQNGKKPALAWDLAGSRRDILSILWQIGHLGFITIYKYKRFCPKSTK